MEPGERAYFVQHFNLCRGTVRSRGRFKMSLSDVAVWRDGQWNPISYGGAFVNKDAVRPALAEAVALLREGHSAEIAVMTERISLLNHIATNALEATP